MYLTRRRVCDQLQEQPEALDHEAEARQRDGRTLPGEQRALGGERNTGVGKMSHRAQSDHCDDATSRMPCPPSNAMPRTRACWAAVSRAPSATESDEGAHIEAVNRARRRRRRTGLDTGAVVVVVGRPLVVAGLGGPEHVHKSVDRGFSFHPARKIQRATVASASPDNALVSPPTAAHWATPWRCARYAGSL